LTSKYDKQQREWRRLKVVEYKAKGFTEFEIAVAMQLTRSLVHKDLEYYKRHCRDIIKGYLDKYLPQQFADCLDNIDMVKKVGWEVVHTSRGDSIEDKKMRIAGASLVNQCISIKSDL